MPWSLKGFQEARCLHFITFSCHNRDPLLGTPEARDVFERTLEQVRRWYGFYVRGYVVVPEHVHLLISEPKRAKLSTALQMLKQNVARESRLPEGNPFWQERYYDFNVWSEGKRIEKLPYIHRNPVTRGLVEKPEDWKWSSFLHYATRVEGLVEIESEWTARKREHAAIVLGVGESQNPRPVSHKTRDKDGAPRESVVRREHLSESPSLRIYSPAIAPKIPNPAYSLKSGVDWSSLRPASAQTFLSRRGWLLQEKV